MDDLSVTFELEEGFAADELKAMVQDRLRQVPDIAEVSIEPRRFAAGGLEILAVLGIVHTSAQLIHDANTLTSDVPTLAGKLKRIVTHLVEIVKGTPGVKEASVNVGLKTVPVTQLSDADVTRIANQIVARIQQEAV